MEDQGTKFGAYPRQVTSNPVTRGAFLGLGLLCVGLGYIGILVPGMPSTVFFIVALWSFSKSSPRLEAWMLSNRLFGKVLRDWRAHRSMSARAKVMALVGLWVGMGTSMILLRDHLLAVGLLAATLLCLTIFIAQIKTR